MCSECVKKYKTEGGRKRHVLNKHTSSQNLLSRDDLKHMMEEVVDKVISDGWYGEEIEQQLKILPSTCCDNEVFVSLIQKCYRDMDTNNDQDKLMLSAFSLHLTFSLLFQRCFLIMMLEL